MLNELKQIFRDEGLLLFLILLPLAYPILYSWIYNNEVARDVPVAVVDESHSSLSREFIRKCDASPDIAVAFHANDMAEARQLLANQEVKGIYHIPSDFDKNIYRLEQSRVIIYCDMSLMLNYKAIYVTAFNVSMDMGNNIKVARAANQTNREDELTTAPLEFEEVAMFNPSGGYGSFVLPGVLMLIMQQVILLGMGLTVGTNRERYGAMFSDRNTGRQDLINEKHVSMSSCQKNSLHVLTARVAAYLTLFLPIAAYLMLVVPRLFSFPTLLRWPEFALISVSYLLACVFFAICFSWLVRRREDVMLIVVFSSILLIFLSGMSWPQSNMPWFWQLVACPFPSTFGIRSFIRADVMGASASDIIVELRALWIQIAVYAPISYWIVKKNS